MSKYLVCLAIVLSATSAQAREGADESGSLDPTSGTYAADLGGPIVVVAGSLPAGRDPVAYPLTVLNDAQLRSVQGPDLTRALRRLPGVTITRNSGIGGFTGVRVRGAGAEQLLVLIDGVKVNDASAPGGGFDFGNLSAEEIGGIELLRGSHSVIWGSDAIAGVMNLSTRTVNGLAASAEYGGAHQFTGQALAGFDSGSTSASISGGVVSARGISAAAVGSEPDGFDQWHVSGRARAQAAGGLSLFASGRYASGELEIDGFPAPLYTFADTNERQQTRERSGRAGAEYTSGALGLSAAIVRSANDRDLIDYDADSEPYYRTRGQVTRAEFFGRGRLGPLDVAFGADREWSRFKATSAFSQEAGAARTASGHAMLTYSNGFASIGGGARYDDHSRFGGALTLGANGSLKIAPFLIARASYGEGFKAPTLFQLLSDYGNENLDPERSRSFDAGLSYNNAAFTAELSLFRRESRDLIDFISCFGVATGICAGRPFGTYDNVGRARAQGFELELGARPAAGLSVQGVYSYVEARDLGGAKDLARRPRHAATVSGDWTIDPSRAFATTLGADIRLVGDSFDDAGNLVRLDGYALLDLRFSRPLLRLGRDGARTLDLFGRIENLTDARYTEVAGYGVQGRAAFLGLRAGL